ncbi:hypothetical protein F5Y04DRAFT_282993 [Hypomontagnella monticulosa]|nr:hypothetical protein F5Y04DRAFT_282993 [Hypomontagnella monticulosa]
MKAVTFLLISAAAVLAAPAPAMTSVDTNVAAGDGQGGAPASWRLDCGSPGTTALCSATNSGAHCDPVSGELTIILAGTCSACRCVTGDSCSRGCGKE